MQQEIRRGTPPVDPVVVDELRRRLQGEVITLSDEGYDTARRHWNESIDRTPAVIARCASTGDVVAALAVAQAHGLPLAVRGGGHNAAGFSLCDGGVVIDLSPLKQVEIDPDHRTVWAGAGLLGRELSGQTLEQGMAVPTGPVSLVGIGGLTLGGGIGWLGRKHGLAIDSLLAAEVVTVDGQVRRVSAEENPDLFWAIRGGGGNFGIVTGFEYQLHPVSMVLGGLILYPAEQLAEVLRGYRDAVATAPDELTTLVIRINLPPAPFLPVELHGKPVIAVGVCYAGPIEEGQTAVAPLRALATPLADMVRPMPYGVLTRMFDDAAGSGHHHALRSCFLDALGDDAIATFAEHAAALPSPMSQVQLQQLGGAIGRIGADETAYSHRNAAFCVTMIGTWSDPAEGERNVAWMGAFLQAMRPFASGVYVNFLDDEGEERVKQAYAPETYARLRQIKRTYDPENVLRLNQNIRP